MPKHREKHAARLGLPLAQVIAEPIDIRVKRNSLHPRNRSLSKEAALRTFVPVVPALCARF